MRRSVQIQAVVIVVLLFLVGMLFYVLYREDRGVLTVSFLDIGQGDSIYIESPTGRQVLIDGGMGSAVLEQLAQEMPFYDRSLDVVIGTHPDADHIGGLIEMLPRYDVATIVRSSVEGSTPTSQVFEKEMSEEGAQILTAKRGQVIDLGEGAYLEILFPDRAVSRVETNTGCVVARLVYGATAFMLPCDAPDEIENYLVELDGAALRSDVLKAAHHGSKTSSSPLFVAAVAPTYAVLSRGCGNSYGHPHQQTLDTFARFDVAILDTCEEGTITFVSNGATVSLRK